jgi:hypothetical protein
MENSINTNITNFVNKLEKTTGDFGNNSICGGFHNTLVDGKLTIPQKSDPLNFDYSRSNHGFENYRSKQHKRTV